MADKKMSAEDKELKLVNLRKDLANAEKELKTIGDSKTDQIRRKDWLVRLQKAKEQMHHAAMNCENGFRMLEPKYHFQTTEEYQEAQRAVSEEEFFKSQFEFEDTLANVERNIRSKDEQLASQTAHAENLRKQIAEIEGN